MTWLLRSFGNTLPASCQSRQPSRQTSESALTRPSVSQVRIRSPEAGPNCPPDGGRTYQIISGASAIGSAGSGAAGSGGAGGAGRLRLRARSGTAGTGRTVDRAMPLAACERNRRRRGRKSVAQGLALARAMAVATGAERRLPPAADGNRRGRRRSPAASRKRRRSDYRAAAGWNSQRRARAEHLAAAGIARKAGRLARQNIGRGIGGLGRFRIVLIQGLRRRLAGAFTAGRLRAGRVLCIGIWILAPQNGQIPRLPAWNSLTFSLCPLGQKKRIPIDAISSRRCLL